MTAQNLVIVESPAKAKTINKYLGPDYVVIASYGHVRDLVGKDGSVLPDEDFAMRWELGERSAKAVNEIKREAKKASTIWLATDPDREGEAISWHVQELLGDASILNGKDVRRVTFNEITKNAVQQAFENARGLDEHLVDAYLARRALDYLFGFTLSPVLWRKLPGSKSAGRVQSVALRLICERETEIEKFITEEYWSIEAKLHTPEGAPFLARLTHLSGNRLGKLDIGSEKEAKAAAERIRSKALSVQKVEKKQVRRNPAPPFITSTLQMDASRNLRLSAAQTMRIAQQLYEGVDIGGDTVGLITYMRTDGTTLSNEAVEQCRSMIKSRCGDKYLPAAPRLYKSKAKNAQEAHEAIRPTDAARTPEDMRRYLNDEQAKLYELIWKRTVASQMESAVLDQVSADISDGTDDVVLRATGSVIAFDGFLKLYRETLDEEDEKDEENRILPPLKEGDKTKTIEVMSEQHFTQPPPRYSEASLVKKLEELGIGRPSTYASILQVLRDRNYVTMDRRRFVPEDRGRLVTAFLAKFFPRYVDYSFTADLEEELDAISTGHVFWKEALKLFWTSFKRAVDETKDLTITQVIDHLDAELGAHFFREGTDGKDPRKCPSCEDGKLSLKLGKYGAFIGCSNYPECRYTRPLVVQEGEESDEDREAAKLANEPKILGTDPGTGRTVSLRRGPYGPYVQLDLPEETADKKAKPKRQGIPRGTDVNDVTLEVALKLLSLPREIGNHPETGEKIEAGIGRFGPYLKYQGKFRSLPKDEDVLHVGMNRAVEILAQPAPERKGKGKGTPAAKAKKTTAKKK
ncbi:MAG: type I DNA topoisomerase [Alphaproteobacteria bacterium]|nr:type I DNA topoisomerase [Alphaproteobacteria bacterium]